MNNKKHLQNLGESLAYTSKGLFKTADILKIFYKTSLWISIIFPVMALTFEMNSFIMKFIGFVSFLAAIYVLINQKHEQKAIEYMKLGNEFLKMYNEVERAYYEDGIIANDIYERQENFLNETSTYSISFIAKFWVDKTIKNEMNLDWTKNT